MKTSNFIETTSIIDEANYKQIFDSLYPGLCLFANKIVQNLEESEDIVQNVFITLWNKNKYSHNYISIKAYLYKAVHNSCLNHIKHKTIEKKQAENLSIELSTENNYLNKRIEVELLEEIFSVIEELPEECKKIFKLSYINGYEVSQVAEELNISVNTVKTQRLRARKFLKERLKNVFPLALYIFYNL